MIEYDGWVRNEGYPHLWSKIDLKENKALIAEGKTCPDTFKEIPDIENASSTPFKVTGEIRRLLEGRS